MGQVTIPSSVENSTAPRAQTKTLYDINNFVLKGVRLGNSADEALRGLAEHYSVNREEIKVKRVTSHMPITDYKNAPYEISYKSADESVVVKLTPSLPREDIGYAVVSSVKFSFINSNSRDQAKTQATQFSTAFAKIYGPPSVNHSGAGRWCSKLTSTQTSCDRESAHLRIGSATKVNVILSDPEYRRQWLDVLVAWAAETDNAGSIKYASSINNLTTHVCHLSERPRAALANCKIGETNGDTVEILDTFSGLRFSDFARSSVYKIIDINQVKIGETVGIATDAMIAKGKRSYYNMKTIGQLESCELMEIQESAITLKCRNGVFDIKKEWAVGLENV